MQKTFTKQGGEAPGKETEGTPGESGAHATHRYRCFLPDLAGFAGSRCPEPGAPSVRSRVLALAYGGERGIRTPEALLRHLHDFQSCSFGRSDISPNDCVQMRNIRISYRQGQRKTRGMRRIRVGERLSFRTNEGMLNVPVNGSRDWTGHRVRGGRGCGHGCGSAQGGLGHRWE